MTGWSSGVGAMNENNDWQHLHDRVTKLFEPAEARKMNVGTAIEGYISSNEFADQMLDRFGVDAAIEAAEAGLKKARSSGDTGVIAYLQETIAYLHLRREPYDVNYDDETKLPPIDMSVVLRTKSGSSEARTFADGELKKAIDVGDEKEISYWRAVVARLVSRWNIKR